MQVRPLYVHLELVIFVIDLILLFHSRKLNIKVLTVTQVSQLHVKQALLNQNDKKTFKLLKSKIS